MPEALGAERLDRSVEPELLIPEAEPTQGLENLVDDRATLLQVELHRSHVPSEHLEVVAERRELFVPHPRRVDERVVAEHEPADRITTDVELRPSDVGGDELPEVVPIVHPMPNEGDATPHLRLVDEPGQSVARSRNRSGRWFATRGEDRVCVEEQDLAGLVRVGHRTDHRRLVVDDGDDPVAGESQPSQRVDLRRGDVFVQTGSVHEQHLGGEGDPVDRTERVQGGHGHLAHRLGASRVDGHMGSGVELEPSDYAEHALVWAVRRRDGLRIAEALDVPGPNIAVDPFGQGERFEDLVDVGLVIDDVLRRDPSQVLRPWCWSYESRTCTTR
jgi:hypothetical protein